MFIVCIVLLIFLGIPGDVGILVLSLLQISLSATKYISFQNGEAVYYTKITNETMLTYAYKYICLFLVYTIHVE